MMEGVCGVDEKLDKILLEEKLLALLVYLESMTSERHIVTFTGYIDKKYELGIEPDEDGKDPLVRAGYVHEDISGGRGYTITPKGESFLESKLKKEEKDCGFNLGKSAFLAELTILGILKEVC